MYYTQSFHRLLTHSQHMSFLFCKSYTNSLLTTDIETINYEYESNKIKKFNKFRISGSYNAGIEKNNEYLIGYSYFDDCFGINIDFNRKDYIAENIEPNDTLTLTFSFKNMGSYQSSNLAVSETDKQDIEWINIKSKNDLFN